MAARICLTPQHVGLAWCCAILAKCEPLLRYADRCVRPVREGLCVYVSVCVLCVPIRLLVRQGFLS